MIGGELKIKRRTRNGYHFDLPNSNPLESNGIVELLIVKKEEKRKL